MKTIFDALCRLLAPILAFTADEAWTLAHGGESVHCEEFPELTDVDKEAVADVDELLRLRGVVGQAIEKARQEKLIVVMHWKHQLCCTPTPA